MYTDSTKAEIRPVGRLTELLDVTIQTAREVTARLEALDSLLELSPPEPKSAMANEPVTGMISKVLLLSNALTHLKELCVCIEQKL